MGLNSSAQTPSRDPNPNFLGETTERDFGLILVTTAFLLKTHFCHLAHDLSSAL